MPTDRVAESSQNHRDLKVDLNGGVLLCPAFRGSSRHGRTKFGHVIAQK